MSKHEEGELILKLYELRREATMRQARDWYVAEFNPETFEDYKKILFGEHGGHLRMVTSYWDMAAALVNHGAISPDLFSDTNGEHFAVFAKIELLLGDIRTNYGLQYMRSLERLIDDTKGGRERCATFRERLKGMLAERAAMLAKSTAA